MMVSAMALALLLAPGLSQGPGLPRLLGRCPVGTVTSVRSGRFVSADIDDLLVVQDLGRIDFPLVGKSSRVSLDVVRLALLRLAGSEFVTVWQSEPMMPGLTGVAGVAGTAWAVDDFDGNGREELVLLRGDSCRLVSFGPDSVTSQSLPSPSKWVVDACGADFDSDGTAELVTLETAPSDSTDRIRILSVGNLQSTMDNLQSSVPLGLDWGEQIHLSLLGSARLDDYYGRLPVLACIHADLRPSLYAVVTADSFGKLHLNARPFPYADWFRKDTVLAAGELSLLNAGDTLIAWGYFVPGFRSGGPSSSFAALTEGTWRLLPLADVAARLSGPVCRFSVGTEPGWLELRDSVFHFYPGEVFCWR